MTASLEELSATIAGLQHEVAVLRAKDDLRDLVVTYARGCDQGNNPALLRPLFTDDATWECKGYGRYVGGDMVAAGLHAVAGNSIFWSLHNMISPQIALDSDEQGATLFWYLWEAATLPHDETGESEAHWIGGTYDARARKVDGKWLFSSLELRLDMATPVTKCWVQQRFPAGQRQAALFCHPGAGDLCMVRLRQVADSAILRRNAYRNRCYADPVHDRQTPDRGAMRLSQVQDQTVLRRDASGNAALNIMPVREL